MSHYFYSMATNARQAGEIDQQETAEERKARIVGEFSKRLAFLDSSFRNCLASRDGRQTYNESLSAIACTLNPRARSKPDSERVDIEVELLINGRAMALARARDPQTVVPVQADIDAAGLELTKSLAPRRGRPPSDILIYHVHALMALYRQFTRKDLRSSRTRNSEYDPRISTSRPEVFLDIFRAADPSVTMTQLTTIIRDAHKSKAVERKTFQDFFPFYGGSIDPETGFPIPAPGYKLVSFQLISPINCS